MGQSHISWKQAHTEPERELPTETRIADSYPNPFNPSTTINYALSDNLYVTLKIYDVLGREVATLVDMPESAGYKSVSFDASSLPSGLYFYRFHAGSVNTVKKMLLMK